MNFIESGGPIMWPLLALSIVSVSVILERMFFAFSYKTKQDKEQRSQFIAYLKTGNITDALKLSQHSSDPLLQASKWANTAAKNVFQISYSEEANKLLRRIRRGSQILDTAITMAPLLGLLGTVIGLIEAFRAIGESGVSSPLVVTGGIGEALLATAFGLAVAIISLIPFNLIINHEEKVRQELEEIGTAIESLLDI